MAAKTEQFHTMTVSSILQVFDILGCQLLNVSSALSYYPVFKKMLPTFPSAFLSSWVILSIIIKCFIILFVTMSFRKKIFRE